MIVKKDLVVVSLVDLMPNVEPKYLEAIKLKLFAYVKMDILEMQTILVLDVLLI